MARRIASLWLTLACLIAAAGVAVIGEIAGFAAGPYIALPSVMLFVNLVAAMATNRKLYAKGGLLGFHLALAALALLVAFDMLAAFDGHVEVTEGAAFDPALVEASAGPLHRSELDRVVFIQGSFTIKYAAGMKRRDTLSRIYVPAKSRRWDMREVGDDQPFTARGYKFYTSFNKGFAPLLTFIDRNGTTHKGTVHLPSYPLNYFKQGNDWTPPGETRPVKLWLHLPQPAYVEDADWEFNKPASAAVVVISGSGRHELAPGATMKLYGGTLRFDELRSWMGYTISYHPALAWIVAAAVIGVLCLLWHVVAMMFFRPWNMAQPDTVVDHVR